METDRGAVLAVRAALRGVIDYSKAQLLDAAWWRRCHILLRGMAKEDTLTLQQGVFNFHLALVSNSGLTEESFNKQQELARDAFYDIMGTVRPWEGVSADARKHKEISDLKQAYIQAWGDPSDPAWQARQAQALAAWQEELKNSTHVSEEDEWARVNRRLAERAQRNDKRR